MQPQLSRRPGAARREKLVSQLANEISHKANLPEGIKQQWEPTDQILSLRRTRRMEWRGLEDDLRIFSLLDSDTPD